MNDVIWNEVEFKVFPRFGTTWRNVSGIYIFAGLTPQNLWRAYYVGKCESFQNRFQDHERWDEAARLGATHVHARVVPLEATRHTLETSLIRLYQPPLNTHFR